MNSLCMGRMDNSPDKTQPTGDTLQLDSLGLDELTLAELSRLRAAMGFISESDATPRVIDGRYKVLRSLGSGGMGVVYLAEDMQLDVQVALKVVRESYLRRVPTAALKLRREAQWMAPLRLHPHVVSVLEFGSDGTTTYLTMEYVAGTDLRRWSEAKPRTRRQILEVYLGAARGLQAAHDKGLAHRDFKPDNVLIGPGDVAKVTDFGIADLADEAFDTAADTQPNAGPRNKASAVRGTMAYIPKEQLDGERADARSDQFSFCIALWETLTGELPYKWTGGQSHSDALRHPPKRANQVPWWLRRALRKGMSEHRRDRHRDMATLIRIIERGLEWPRKFSRISVAAVALLVAGGIGVALSRHRDEPAIVSPTCEAFATTIGTHWGPEQRTVLAGRGEALGVDMSWTIGKLDELATSWSETAVDACVDERDPAVEDPTRRCLDEWLVSLDRTVELLAHRGDQQTLVRAPDLLATIIPPNGDFCAGTPAHRPRDPELADLVEEARAAAVLGDRTLANVRSEAAIERAKGMSSGHPYSAELAHAHAARSDVLRFSGDLEGAAQQSGLAEVHAIGVNDLDTLLHVYVMWAKALAYPSNPAAQAGERQLSLAQPLLYASSTPENALIRGELLEARALSDQKLGDLDKAAAGYAAASNFFGERNNPILAARARSLRGNLEHARGRFVDAEADLRWAIEVYESEGVPADYPRLLDAVHNLATVLYDHGGEVEDDEFAIRLNNESLQLFERVIAHASAPLRLSALGAACQVAADTEQLDRLRVLAPQAVAALDAGEAVENHDVVEAQVALAMLIGLQDAEAEARVKSLLARTELPLELRWGLVRSWIAYLEDEGRCKEAQLALDEVSGLDQLEDFRTWINERPNWACP